MMFLPFCAVFLSHSVIYVAGTESENSTLDTSSNFTEISQPSVILSLLNNAKNLIEDATKYAVKIRCPTARLHCDKPMDCSEIYEKDPLTVGGMYRIWPRSRVSSGPITVYCDMEDDGGGWTVIQRRGDFDSPADYFYQGWAAYKMGFGDLLRDFWLGNDNIFALTNQKFNRVKFSLSDWEGNKTYAIYDEFWIDDELNNYTMHIKDYRGTAGKGFNLFTIPFTTKDKDNDMAKKSNCAILYKGAWWYDDCHDANLNGLYLKGPHESTGNGVIWYYFRGNKYSLKDTTIKIRPKDFEGV